MRLFNKIYLFVNCILLCPVYSLASFIQGFSKGSSDEKMTRFNEVVFILGLGVIAGYYGLTCFVFILAFLTGYTSVTIHMNLLGEMTFEVIITVLSIPFAMYAIKETIRLKKAELREMKE